MTTIIPLDPSRVSATAPEQPARITRHDVIPATVIATVAAVGFALGGTGMTLAVTFAPGMVVAWLTFIWLYRTKATLPPVDAFLPVFFTVLAIQFLHFAEEYSTGFRTDFALLYDGTAYSAKAFVIFNMVSYAAFTMSCLAAFLTKRRFLLMPALFFIIYGAIGNAIAHTWWSIHLGEYFPGLVTAQLYWIAGPWVLYRLIGDRRQTARIVAGFAAVLIPLLTIFADTGAV